MSDTLKIGDHIKDNDPRVPDRVLEVTSNDGSRVKARSLRNGITVTIKRNRIFIDGKERRSGFNRVARA